MINPRFWYWILPGTSWFESFARNFVSPDIQMWGEDTEGPPQYFAWASNHFNDVAGPEELADRSAALKAVFDGAVYLACGAAYHPATLKDLESSNEGFHRTSWYFNGIADVRAEPFSAAYIASRSARCASPLERVVPKLIFLARYDEITKALLKYVGVQGLTYVSLYSCCDWMKDGGWDARRIAAEAGWSNTKYRDFRNTANNPAYLGPFARHGGGSNSPAPARPMKLQEAIDPIRTATVEFLMERAANVNLEGAWQAIRG